MIGAEKSVILADHMEFLLADHTIVQLSEQENIIELETRRNQNGYHLSAKKWSTIQARWKSKAF